MEHLADSWCDVHDVGGLGGLAVIDVPAKEDEWDVGIVGVPHAVGGANIVGLVTYVLPTSLCNIEDFCCCRV